MRTYYELCLNRELMAFDTLEETMQFADENGVTVISTIGDNWTEYEKCPICGEWCDSCEIEEDGLCFNCHYNGIAHGF